MFSGKALILIIVLIALIGLYFFLPTLTDKCAGIKDPYLREKCYKNEAIEKKDPSICDKIEDKDGCNTCKKEVQDILASENENVSGKSVPVSGSGGGGGGSGESSEDTELGCEAFSGNQRDWCYRDEAIEDKDPSFCLKIQDSYNRDSCYRYLALETGDESYCDYMQDEFRRLWCHEALK